MAASMFSPKRPQLPRALSSKNSNPYLTMNKLTPSTSAPASPTHPPIPDFIMPGLYLTDLFTARQVLLPTYHPSPTRPHIKYTLSILDNSITQPHPKPPSRESLFTQRLIILDDTPDADLLNHLASACDWIDECIAKADGGVLVHCHLGQSRSAAIVIAYMMRKDKLPLQKALDRAKWRRSIVKPNPGFMKQLALWEEMAFEIWEDVEVEDVAAGSDALVVVVSPDLVNQKPEEVQEKIKEAKDTPEGAEVLVAEIVGKQKKTIRRRKQPYELWKMDQEKRTKRYLDNLV